MCVFRLPCSFRSSAGSSMMDLMMRLLITSASHGSCSLDGVDHDRHSGRVLAFNKKVANSSPHVIDMTEDNFACD